MSLGTVARAVPTLVKIGFAEAVAYRAEFLVWMLSTTMPLIMLALWSAVARDGPVGRFGQSEFVAYFLATFIVRQLTGAWVAWQMNYEIRQGTLAMRLLRPIHPLIPYAVENLAAQPLRLLVALPVAAAGLGLVGTQLLPRDPLLWMEWCAAMLGAWLITFFASCCIGCLAFYLDSSIKLMEAWLALYFVLSGYLFPVELLPAAVRRVVDWLPFRYQIGLPVELMTSAHDPRSGLLLLGRQWAFAAMLLVTALVVWRRGLARFAAYGG
ncbi:MAG TPA: ABC-2 family transporter protein [Candidatus Polarisedimenticolaceae bacterium]|nr:ABC-2 family transporter protein [Candidatus Polarisedimenticolaceae bacterium]